MMSSVSLICLGYQGQDDKDIKGGMTIYYTQKDFNTSDLDHYTTAFPPVRCLTSAPLLKRYV
jgi:hypothetical protein